MSVIINRKALHAALDAFLDDVEQRPLNVDDGEEHAFKLEGGRAGYDDNDNELVAFTVTTSRRQTV